MVCRTMVNECGVFVVPIQYDKIKQLACGLIKVKKDGKITYKTLKGG